MDLRKTNLRQGQKKVALFPEIGRVKTFCQMCKRIYIFCFKKTHRNNKKISTSKIIRTNLHFFSFKKQKIGLFVFLQRKVLL